jgi:hypothetical protein
MPGTHRAVRVVPQTCLSERGFQCFSTVIDPDEKACHLSTKLPIILICGSLEQLRELVNLERLFIERMKY